MFILMRRSLHKLQPLFILSCDQLVNRYIKALAVSSNSLHIINIHLSPGLGQKRLHVTTITRNFVEAGS